MPSPHLPPELEYEIFILALENNHKDGKNLILVAKRVFDWLIPRIFRVVLLHSTRSIPIKFNKAAHERYGHYVEHLFIEPNEQGKYIGLFPNAKNLVLWTDYNSTYVKSLLTLPLTRLSIAPSDLHPPSLELFQVFSKLTHLDLVSMASCWGTHLDIVKELLHLPKLTHLCVMRGFSAKTLELFLDRSRCPKLRVVILWEFSDNEAYLEKGGFPGVYDDGRVLRIKCQPLRDWEVGARGGVDMWKLADSIMASRTT
ncbi:hypothetical protein BDN72DRAFT_963884 [Pluteus cervinus]|uniref:Uncharacterized protein n=1 Tax=Pluteus cervinus TaxID=181527 RepID=A0ACD3ACW2_9AGAR|nr:hypothetical protein BDN72DRAFT_963884 [Pluteus cervinus]